MYQWAETVTSLLDLGVDIVSLHGDSIDDSHENGKKIMIRIVNSAVNKNAMQVDVASHHSEHHLIVADECHMYGGKNIVLSWKFPVLACWEYRRHRLMNCQMASHIRLYKKWVSQFTL